MLKFSDIVGQKQIKEHMQRALLDGRVSHAYIIDGARDSDKDLVADVFAAAIQCADPATDANGMPEPCGKCISCIQAAAKANGDIIYVQHEKPKSIGIGDIRLMRDDVAIKPYSCEHKVYIINDAELMTAAAQNALLKTLEEPPEYAVILLLADGVSNFLPTVMSRCVTLRMKPVPEEKIEEYCRRRIEEEASEHPGEPVNTGAAEIKMAAGFSGGNAGRALKILGSESFDAKRQAAAALFENIGSRTGADLVQAAQEFSGKKAAGKTSGKKQPKDAVAEDDNNIVDTWKLTDFLEIWFHDVSIYKATGERDRIVFCDHTDGIIRISDRISFEGLQNIRNAVGEYDKRRRANVSDETALEMLLLSVRSQLH